MKQLLSALVCGILFGAGLVISGMTSTAKVLGFLDVLGQWDITLLFVMGTALLVTLLTTPLILRQPRPVFADEFNIPTSRMIDQKLILGAIIFGLGWGLYGLCPGPAIVSIIYGHPETYIFISIMVLGMFFHKTLSNRGI